MGILGLNDGEFRNCYACKFVEIEKDNDNFRLYTCTNPQSQFYSQVVYATQDCIRFEKRED